MWQKSAEELRQTLSAPFASEDIEWRVSATTRDKEKGLAVPYVDNRAIQNRLDDTVGIDGWRNEFLPWKNGAAQLCGISIHFQPLDLWLTKWDGADDSDIESVKGGLSDSMKRAAVEWGIGRYLYGMTQVWVKITQRGNSFVINDEERPKLDQAHDSWVQKLFSDTGGERPRSNGQSQPKNTAHGNPRQSQPQPTQGAHPSQDMQQQHGQPGNTAQQSPNGPQQRQAPRTGQSPAIPQQGRQTAPQGTSAVPSNCFLITGAVMKPTVSGGQRLNLQMQSSDGQSFQAFLRSGYDNRLAPGTLLTDAQFTSQNSNGVTFYILEAYRVVDESGRAA